MQGPLVLILLATTWSAPFGVDVAVVDATGGPVPGALVSVVRVPDGPGQTETPVAHARTDTGGHAQLAIAEPGRYAIRSQHSGFIPVVIGSFRVTGGQLARGEALKAIVVMNPSGSSTPAESDERLQRIEHPPDH